MLGLRFRSYSLALGSTFDWFVPEEDMPDVPNKRGYKTSRDDIETSRLNTWAYDKGKRKEWEVNFVDISVLSKERLEFLDTGWFGSRQICMVYFGSSVTGTTISAGSLSSVGQCWGTGYFRLMDIPEEADVDLWNVRVKLIEHGPDQTF